MPIPRYNTAGPWYKGNAHLHSTASDGGKTFAELASLYSAAGYDFLFRTDHWVASDIQADPTEYPLLWLDGIELDGADHGGSRYHVVGLGSFTGLTSEMGLVAAMEAIRAQDGLLILAHAAWMGNSQEDALRWGFHGVEVYNHVCQWLNGKGNSSFHWHTMLQRFPQTLGLAVDDAHIRPEHPGWNGGWIMVHAPECSREALFAAIRAGHFYSSRGPEFQRIETDGSTVTIQTSPVQFVRLVGPRSTGQRVGSFDGQLRTEASFEIPSGWDYAYLEIQDAQGRCAWTNTLFTETVQQEE